MPPHKQWVRTRKFPNNKNIGGERERERERRMLTTKTVNHPQKLVVRIIDICGHGDSGVLHVQAVLVFQAQPVETISKLGLVGQQPTLGKVAQDLSRIWTPLTVPRCVVV